MELENEGAQCSRDTQVQIESDWEYEYDENDTEEFLVNLDLTSFLASSQRKPHEKTVPVPEASIEQEQQRLQILRLHDQNPLVTYRGRLYKCSWASAVGTDLYLFKPDVPRHETVPYLPISAGLGLGMTSALLAAKPAHVSPHPAYSVGGPKEPFSKSVDKRPPKPQPLSSLKEEQEAFLKEIALIKAARGNTDQVAFSVSAEALNDSTRFSGDDAAAAAAMNSVPGNIH